MKAPGILVRLLLRPLRGRERDEVLADLDELRSHRALERGRLSASAWYAAELVRFAWRLRVGGGTRADSWVTTLLRDLRFSARSLVRAPGVTFVAVPTLALALGASTALFSFADALVLRPLSVREPNRLVSLLHVSAEGPRSYSSFSRPHWRELAERNRVLEGLAAWSPIEGRVGDGPEAERVQALIVSANYFDVLGAPPVLGRGFVAEEDRTPGTDPVVVLSHGLWTRRFGGDPAIVGRDVTVNGRPFRVVGVASARTPSLDVASEPDLWVPLMMHEVVLPGLRFGDVELFDNRGTHWLELLGRLRDGVTVEQARAAFRALAAAQADEHPETDAEWSITVEPAGAARNGPPGSRPVVLIAGLLAAVVAMVLLIACANVANLLLARAATRRQELGIRLALGAGRGRLIRQLLTEALLLAAVGGVAGVLLAAWLTAALPSLGLAAGLPGLAVRLDGRVLIFSGVVVLAAAAFFGVVPALRASSVGIQQSAWRTDMEGTSRRRVPLRRLLVAVQVALSLVLLVGAGLALRTVWNLGDLPLGFDAERLETVQLRLPPDASAAAARGDLYGRIVSRLQAEPDVESAATALLAPFSRMRMANDIFWERGDSASVRDRTNVDMNVVGVGYFETMGIPLLRGRPFGPEDEVGAQPVAVVNRALADELWPGRDPLGRRVWNWNPQGPDTPLEVVGVVADGRYHRSWSGTAAQPFLFLPAAQKPTNGMGVLVRAAGNGLPSALTLRRALLDVDPEVEVEQVRTATQAMRAAISLQRTSARLLTFFGALAGVMAIIGIYGVVSFTVSRCTREIGVRMALGARPGDVVRRVLAGSAVPIAVGMVVGWIVAALLARFMAILLYGVTPFDALTYAAVGALLAGVGLLASAVPARRATRVDPVTALRDG